MGCKRDPNLIISTTLLKNVCHWLPITFRIKSHFCHDVGGPSWVGPTYLMYLCSCPLHLTCQPQSTAHSPSDLHQPHLTSCLCICSSSAWNTCMPFLPSMTVTHPSRFSLDIISIISSERPFLTPLGWVIAFSQVSPLLLWSPLFISMYHTFLTESIYLFLRTGTYCAILIFQHNV